MQNYLDSFVEDDPEQTLQDISLLAEIGDLLELELSYCSDSKKRNSLLAINFL